MHVCAFSSFALVLLVNCTAVINIDHVEFNLCEVVFIMGWGSGETWLAVRGGVVMF